MNSGNAVVMARPAQSQRGHIELLALVAAEGQQRFGIAADLLRVTVEVMSNHILGKMIMAGGHGRVGGEYRVACRRVQGAGEVEAVAHQLPYALEDQECGVALVDMPYRRLQPQRLER